MPRTRSAAATALLTLQLAALLAPQLTRVAAAATAATARPGDVFKDRALCELLEWPCIDNGELPDLAAFVHEELVASECMKSCLPPELEHLHRQYAAQRQAEGDENDDEHEETVRAAADNDESTAPHTSEEPSDEREPVDAMAMDALWHCEVECKALEEIPRAQVPRLFEKNKHGRYLVLWESRVFAHPDHSRQARSELAKLASDLRKQKHSQLSPIIYRYAGWHPNDADVMAWWRDQHASASQQRPWQSVPESFGGWGRATMSLIEDGEIVWDVFDVVHSSKHWRFLHEFDFGNEDILRELDPFGVAGDLAGALHYILERFDQPQSRERLPLQACLQVARIVLGPRFKQDLVHGKDEHHMEALAEFCEDIHEDDEQELTAHRGDIDYERYALMVKQMGVVDSEGTLWKHALTTWRSVMSFQQNEARRFAKQSQQPTDNDGTPGTASSRNADIALMASIVPVYEGGIEGDLGVGDRQEALMVSLCYKNASIPEGITEDRYATHGKHVQSSVNTDVFLAVVPCEDLSTRQVLRCIKAILADARAGSLDLEISRQGGRFSVVDLIFGVGFVGKPEYAALQPYWSADSAIPGQGEFPADHITEKYANEHQRRNKKPSKMVFKDEL